MASRIQRDFDVVRVGIHRALPVQKSNGRRWIAATA